MVVQFQMPVEEVAKISSEKRKCFDLAKLCEQLQHWDDMTEYVRRATLLDAQLTDDERSLLTIAFKNAMAERRKGISILVEEAGRIKNTTDIKYAQFYFRKLRKYKNKVQRELKKLAGTLDSLLSEQLIPATFHAHHRRGVLSRLAYNQMLGDTYRYCASSCIDDKVIYEYEEEEEKKKEEKEKEEEEKQEKEKKEKQEKQEKEEKEKAEEALKGKKKDKKLLQQLQKEKEEKEEIEGNEEREKIKEREEKVRERAKVREKAEEKKRKREEELQAYVRKAERGYTEALKQADTAQLSNASSTRLGIILNYTVFLREVCNRGEEAIRMASDALKSATRDIPLIEEAEYSNSVIVLQLLRNNIYAWASKNTEYNLNELLFEGQDSLASYTSFD